jgi:predicted DNA-binding ribbon-helix-helix protein
MCEYFVKADPIQYEQRSRTVRIRNVLTSIRLENMVWEILADMAEEEGCTTNALISKFHDEILVHRGEVPNFASFLRVTSMRYMRRCMQTMQSEQDKLVAPSNAQNTGSIPVLGSSGTFAQGVHAAPKMLAAVGR